MGSSRHTADDFIQFCEQKVESVRASTANCPPSPLPSQPAVNSTLTELRVCSEEDVRRAIVSSPNTHQVMQSRSYSNLHPEGLTGRALDVRDGDGERLAA